MPILLQPALTYRCWKKVRPKSYKPTFASQEWYSARTFQTHYESVKRMRINYYAGKSLAGQQTILRSAKLIRK